MQTPKASRTGSSEVPQRKSPATPRTARQLKTPGSDAGSVTTSPKPATKTPKARSPKVLERKSPSSPMSEKKRTGKVSELESQLSQLQEDLKKARDQLNASEAWKRRAQQEAEEVKKQLSAMSAKLEETQQQLEEITTSEDARVEELRKISQERDKEWQSELDAVQKQHSMDSAALASALNEIQKLRVQLEKVSESEAAQSKHAESAYAEMQSLRVELTETLSLVEKLKTELTDCKESEARAVEVLGKTQMQLGTTNATMEMLRSDAVKAAEAYNSLSMELEQSKSQVKSLEELVRKLQADLANGNSNKSLSTGDVEQPEDKGDKKEIEKLKDELYLAKSEVHQLRSALDSSEARYQEEYIRSTLQIRSAYEQVEHTKSELSKKEAELEAELTNARTHIEELKANVMDKEKELQNVSENNHGLSSKANSNQSNERELELAEEFQKVESDLVELKARLLDKETQLQSLTEENETLKLEIEKNEIERNKVSDEAIVMAEAARAAEREALMKVDYLTEEADKSCRRAERVTEQLDAAQVANTELETELRRLKVQSDQWRKAAEAATAMLSSGNSGKFVERAASLDGHYNHVTGSPYSEDMDDDSPKKKNANMLKKIGVLWKKGQK